MTKDKYPGRYRLGLNSTFVPDSSPFQSLKMSVYPNQTEEDMNNLAKVSEHQQKQRAIKKGREF